MLRKRLLTLLTFTDGILTRTKNFCPDYRYTLSFVDAWSIDEIVVLDVTRPGEGKRDNFFNIVNQFAESCFVPIAAGGGVRSVEDFRKLLAIGADKVVINTGAVYNPKLITEAAEIFGSQCVVVSIDAKKNGDRYEVFAEFGKRSTGLEVSGWSRHVQELGAGEILITSIDKDGSLEGYDNQLNRLVSETVNIPVLACGGAGNWQDLVDGFIKGGVSGACMANIYHFTETSIQSAKRYLKNSGIPVRI